MPRLVGFYEASCRIVIQIVVNPCTILAGVIEWGDQFQISTLEARTMNGHSIEDLAAAIERWTGKDGTHSTAIDGLTLFRASGMTDSVATVYEPSLCVMAQGRKQVTLGDEVYTYDPARFLLASVALPVVGKVIEGTPDAPYLALRIGIDPAEVGALIADGGLSEAEVWAESCRGLAVSRMDSPLLDAVARLVGLLDTPESIGVLAPLVRREITYRLLVGEQGGRLRQIAVGDGQTRRIIRAIQWLKTHFAEPLRIEELARQVSLSPSALHQHFKAVTALSPLQYQKQLRLQEARRLLLAEGLDAAGAGYRVGYESPSQFSREYRRLFGRPPRMDLDALRTVSMREVERV